MKKLVIPAILFVLAISSVMVAQRNVVLVFDRDLLMDAYAKHNLDVALQGFSGLKKAYKQVIYFFDEIYFSYTDFSKMDQCLYIAGMSSYYLSDNKGKQKVDFKNEREKEKFAPDKLRKDAVTYLTLIVEKYPQSQFRGDAEKTLQLLKDAK